MIIIAIVCADKIVVMDDQGRILAVGGYNELLMSCQLFKLLMQEEKLSFKESEYA